MKAFNQTNTKPKSFTALGTAFASAKSTNRLFGGAASSKMTMFEPQETIFGKNNF
ncbi:hypothetical protein [Heyndrickxia sporothermodurans]|uniref:Uncharacterized protein n=1 Tax=Heyndrickxia sporothermodurans TaxID=46224 RepID=A0AB37HEV8_9BACI|nr:hypothetical protein [Heyndrickxia sporothermodurans]MBL5771616.1 hypothetical protein [Heyndrickxia sporothermodurans]MBL5785902.1 hypothetical protein [Heyndrickxia sporothermodurans]MBL5789408.1 hypothetical protein [Heyndrickxia sporothermodurans]MBL5796659.1 hypothetical protein [Heyndrickxia sporothermodurans]MBL5804099.1 hypothetical protein [Heyndrickxia sporothermodurans]